MSAVHTFTANLARAGKRYEEIKSTVEAAFPGQCLSKSQIYLIMKQIREGQDAADNRGKIQARRVRNADFIEAVRLEVEADRRITITILADRFQVSRRTINLVLNDDLGLSKKSARWVPKLLLQPQKDVRFECSHRFLQRFRDDGQAFLDRIVTMDETAVALFTPERKEQSKQWVPRGTPGPIKGKSQQSREKRMVLAFFDNRGLIYSNIVPKSSTVNAKYIIDALKIFYKRLREKRPEKADAGIILHWDNAPVHTAASVRDYLAARGQEMLEHPPYSPDLAPADFWLFRVVKNELAGRALTHSSFKTAWDGVTRGLDESDFAGAFKQWVDRHEKCHRLAGDYVEKCE